MSTCRLTSVSSLLPLFPFALMRAGLLAVLRGLLDWTLMPLAVRAAFFPFAALPSSSSFAARLCVALPPILLSVPVFVTVMMVFAGFFVGFDMADLFARRRRRARLWLWLWLWLRALVLVRMVASSLRRAVLLLLRRRGRVVCVVAPLLFLFHVGGLFLRGGFPCASVASSAASLGASRVCVCPGGLFYVAVGGSEAERYKDESTSAQI